MEVLPLMANVSQKVVLSNGMLLDKPKIEMLAASGIKEVKITLFSSYKEHAFFNRISNEQYRSIIANIGMCKKFGLEVVVDTILSGLTMHSVDSLAGLCAGIGVDKIEFIRLKPIGNARGMDRGLLLSENDMFGVVRLVEQSKAKYPGVYFRYNLSCGPDFYGKSEKEAREKVMRGSKNLAKSSFLCPAIDGNYLGISMRTGNIYSCFFAMDEPGFDVGRINLETGEIVYLHEPKITSARLRKKLRGDCRAGNCQYHAICLGGCRSTAYIFAKLRGEIDPLFAGQDICITKIKERMAV